MPTELHGEARWVEVYLQGVLWGCCHGWGCVPHHFQEGLGWSCAQPSAMRAARQGGVYARQVAGRR